MLTINYINVHFMSPSITVANYNFAYYYVWVCSLVADIEGE
jgi:hypothetical protein